MASGSGIMLDGLLAMFSNSTTVRMFVTNMILYKEPLPEKQMEIQQNPAVNTVLSLGKNFFFFFFFLYNKAKSSAINCYDISNNLIHLTHTLILSVFYLPSDLRNKTNPKCPDA